MTNLTGLITTSEQFTQDLQHLRTVADKVLHIQERLQALSAEFRAAWDRGDADEAKARAADLQKEVDGFAEAGKALRELLG